MSRMSAIATSVVAFLMFIITGLGQEFDLYNLTEGQSEFISEAMWVALGIFGIAQVRANPKVKTGS